MSSFYHSVITNCYTLLAAPDDNMSPLLTPVCEVTLPALNKITVDQTNWLWFMTYAKANPELQLQLLQSAGVHDKPELLPMVTKEAARVKRNSMSWAMCSLDTLEILMEMEKSGFELGGWCQALRCCIIEGLPDETTPNLKVVQWLLARYNDTPGCLLDNCHAAFECEFTVCGDMILNKIMMMNSTRDYLQQILDSARKGDMYSCRTRWQQFKQMSDARLLFANISDLPCDLKKQVLRLL